MSRRYRHFPGPLSHIPHSAHYIAMYPHPPEAEDYHEARRLIMLADGQTLDRDDPIYGQQVAARADRGAHLHVVEVFEHYGHLAVWHAARLRPGVSLGTASADEVNWLARYDAHVASAPQPAIT